MPSKKAAFTKPSRGTSDSERRTIINGNRAAWLSAINGFLCFATQNSNTLCRQSAFRFDCERCRLTRCAAFTLAEVLITLGIIGVVAAMTMPVIIANVRDKSLEAALKKAQSSLINGYRQMMARESVFRVSNLPIMDCARNAACFSPWHKSAFKVVDDSTSGLSSNVLPQEYAIEDKTEPSPFSWDAVPYLFRTADGMSYGVEIDDGNETFSIYADTNGTKAPNTVCKDMLKFRISGIGNIANVCSELEEGGCSIDNLSACDGQQCQDLKAQEEPGPMVSQSAPGIWNKEGHFVSFYCDSNGVSFTRDWCTEGLETTRSYYCR